MLHLLQPRSGEGRSRSRSPAVSPAMDLRTSLTLHGRAGKDNCCRQEYQVQESGLRVLGAAEGMKYAKFRNNAFLFFVLFFSFKAKKEDIPEKTNKCKTQGTRVEVVRADNYI